jgi:succinyl-CoA synthetase beta subunit
MARLAEHQALELLQRGGIRVPRYEVAMNPEGAWAAAARLGGPVVIKALIPSGKRGKAGGILFASDPDEAALCAGRLLGSRLSSYSVDSVLVEERLQVWQELYLSVIVDHQAQSIAVIVSQSGGVDVEEQRRIHPESIETLWVDQLHGLDEFAARQLWHDAGAESSLLRQLGRLTILLYHTFVSTDAYIVELNPLVVTPDGQVVPVAALMGIDDAALFRHPELAGSVQVGAERTWKAITDLEKQVVAVNQADPYRGTARYTEMEGGDIGLLCGGGGASLVLFDALRRAGGKPANYSEVGGNPTAHKVYGIAKAILAKEGVRGLLVAHSITNNTQTDAVAEGVIRALDELGTDLRSFPVLAREAGVNEERAAQLFRERGIEYYGDEITLTEAARLIVERMREVSRRSGGSEGGR